jgi:hypothetical protein
MRVIKRQQVTEVVTNRTVYHTVMLGNTTFERIETYKIVLPYMDCEAIINKPIVKWGRLDGNVITYLNKKTITLLALELRFEKLDIDSKNGNK